MKKYLFICQHNITRSKFGAEFLRGYLKGKKMNAKVSSAGLGIISSIFGNRINEKILKDVDKSFVREDYMKEEIVKKFGIFEKKIFVLGIKDEYGFLKSKSIKELDKNFEKVNWSKLL